MASGSESTSIRLKISFFSSRSSGQRLSPTSHASSECYAQVVSTYDCAGLAGRQRRYSTAGMCSFCKSDALPPRVVAPRENKRTSAPRVASISAMRRPSVPAPRIAIGRVAMFSGSRNVTATSSRIFLGNFDLFRLRLQPRNGAPVGRIFAATEIAATPRCNGPRQEHASTPRASCFGRRTAGMPKDRLWRGASVAPTAAF